MAAQLPQMKIYTFFRAPGIQRDGTAIAAQSYIDGQHVRFYRGLPQKMGGYTQLIGALQNVPRGTYVISEAPNFNVYLGDYESLKYFTIDLYGNVINSLVDRTPNRFAVNQTNQWSFQELYSDNGNMNTLIAYAGQNGSAIDNSIETPVYIGDSSSSDALTPLPITTSGGIVVLHPFLFVYGNNGLVSWSNANDPTTFNPDNAARITAKKIIYGAPTRAGTNSPGGLFWSLDSVVRATYTGTADGFNFDTITQGSCPLSSNAIVEYDGNFYWPTSNRFLAYNGAVQELPNSASLEYFFNNLNFSQRQKVFATKYPNKGEILWHYPTGTNTENNRCLIYNIRENTWYDTAINRSSGYYNEIFNYPIWTDNLPSQSGTYAAWMHEIGTDQVIGNNSLPIQSYFECSPISFIGFDPTGQHQQINTNTVLECIEPDFVQTGQMTLYVKGRQYAQGGVVTSAPYNFNPNDVKIDMNGVEQRRLMTLRFESNTLGCYYEMGKLLMHVRTGDSRP